VYPQYHLCLFFELTAPNSSPAVTGETFRFLHTSLLKLVLEGASATAPQAPAADVAGATGTAGGASAVVGENGAGAGAAHHALPAHAALVQELQRKALTWSETLSLETPQLLSLQADMLCVVSACCRCCMCVFKHPSFRCLTPPHLLTSPLTHLLTRCA
jgi:hypothetical protein